MASGLTDWVQQYEPEAENGSNPGPKGRRDEKVREGASAGYPSGVISFSDRAAECVHRPPSDEPAYA